MYNIWMILIMTPRCEGKTLEWWVAWTAFQIFASGVLWPTDVFGLLLRGSGLDEEAWATDSSGAPSRLGGWVLGSWVYQGMPKILVGSGKPQDITVILLVVELRKGTFFQRCFVETTGQVRHEFPHILHKLTASASWLKPK